MRDLPEQVADTVNNILLIESCCMSTIIHNGFRPQPLLTRWVQNLEVLSHGTGGLQ